MVGLVDRPNAFQLGERGAALGDHIDFAEFLDWVKGLVGNLDDLARGFFNGLLFGKTSIGEDGTEVHQPGLIPRDLSKAGKRLQNAAMLSGLSLAGHSVDFVVAVARGLWNELEGLWSLITSIGEVFSMIGDASKAIARSAETAHSVGVSLGAGLFGELVSASEGPFDKFVVAVGELLGSLLIDVAAAFFTGGGALLLKGGAKIAVKASARVADLAGELARTGRKRFDEARAALEDAVEIAQWAPAGGPGRIPRRIDMPNVAYNQSKGLDGDAQGLGGGARGGSGRLGEPGAAPAASRLNAKQGAAGGAGAGGAGRAGATAAVQSTKKSIDESVKLIQVQKRRPTFPRPAPVENFPMGSRALQPGFGPFLRRVMRGYRLDPKFADLTGLIIDMGQTANAGAVRRVDVLVHDVLLEHHASPTNLHGVAYRKSRRAIQTHSSAILQRPRASRQSHPNYNLRERWKTRRSGYEEHIRPELRRLISQDPELSTAEKRILLDDLANRWEAAHSLGPGMGDEVMAGMGFTGGWINRGVQAGGIRNEVLGILTRRDARRDHGVDADLLNPYLDEVRGTRQADRYGLEGIIIDYARAVESAAKEGGRFPDGTRVHLDTFTESWGDELLDSLLFQEVDELGLALLPQEFVRSVEYRARTVVDVGGRYEELPGLSFALRLDIAPPPYIGEVRVSVLTDSRAKFDGSSAAATLKRSDLRRRAGQSASD